MSVVRSLVTALSVLLVSSAVVAVPSGPAWAAAPAVRGADVEVSEAAGAVEVVLRLDRAPRRATTVSWRTVAGSALPEEDYQARFGKARFERGQRKHVVRVPLVVDGAAEAEESFVVRLRSSQARVPDKNVEVVIADDDDEYSVQLATGRADTHVFDDQVSDEDPTLEGATLSATGPDGTVYTLDVPDGALADVTTVTMTPWKSATGTGITDGKLFGVRLTPAGTEFLLPVTLRVDAPGSEALPVVTATREAGTSYEFPAALDPDEITLNLTHFSEYYGGRGEGTSITILDQGTLNPAQALADEVARTLREERNRQLEGEPADETVMQRVEELMTAYYDHVVQPKLAGIRVSCEEAEAHTGHVVGFARQVALLGMLEAQQQTILGAVIDGSENCLQEAIEPCVDMDDAEQVARIVGYWRQVALFGGTVPDPPPFDPVRHCKDVLTGALTLTVDLVYEANGFRTEEHWKLVYQPRLVNPDSQQTWYDDGRGGWSVSGTYRREDLRPGAVCKVMSEEAYSGSGTLHTSFHPQLNASTDEGEGIAELQYFLPSVDGNFNMTPQFDGEVVGHFSRTSYQSSGNQCESWTTEGGHWFSPYWGPNMQGAPGTIVTSEQGKGVEFDYTYTKPPSQGATVDTYQVELTGTLLPTRG